MEKKLREPLGHDGGKLLRMLMDRLSIPREDWLHDYCTLDVKEHLPKKKANRLLMLSADINRLRERIRLTGPCVIVGMGSLPCEVLTGATLVSTRAGTCWSTLDYGKVWISYAPEKALYEPSAVVEIYGVLAKAAEAAGIETKFNPNVRVFNWQEYEHQRA